VPKCIKKINQETLELKSKTKVTGFGPWCTILNLPSLRNKPIM